MDKNIRSLTLELRIQHSFFIYKLLNNDCPLIKLVAHNFLNVFILFT